MKPPYTAHDVAKLLGKTYSDIHYHIDKGHINPTKWGRQYVITAEDLETLKTFIGKPGRKKKSVKP